MHRDDDRVLIFDITRAGERILSYTSEGRDAFMADPKTQDAVIRNLEIIGEAAGKFSDRVKGAATDVDWRRVVGMRIRARPTASSSVLTATSPTCLLPSSGT